MLKEKFNSRGILDLGVKTKTGSVYELIRITDPDPTKTDGPAAPWLKHILYRCEIGRLLLLGCSLSNNQWRTGMEGGKGGKTSTQHLKYIQNLDLSRNMF